METLINICRWVIKSARSILVALLVICLGVPATLYVMLSTDWAQSQLRTTGEITLERLLGVKVEIGDVRLRPFSRLSLYDVVIHDDYGRKALALKEVEARIELTDFLMQKGLIIDYATINSLDARIYRPTPDSPLNIDGIIRNLTSEKPKTEAKTFTMRLNTVEILNSAVSYNVYGTELQPMHFDPNHMALSEVNAVLHAPIVSTAAYGVRLRRLSFVERSGFRVNDIYGDFSLSNDSLLIRDLAFMLPGTALEFDDISAAIDTIADLPHIGTRFPVTLGLKEGSHISLSDFKAFMPELGRIGLDVSLSLQARGTLDSLCVESMSVYDNVEGLSVKAHGCAKGLSSPLNASVSGFEVMVNVDSRNLLAYLLRASVRLSPRLRHILTHAGPVHAAAHIDGGLTGLDFDALLYADLLKAEADGFASYSYDNGALRYDAHIDLADANLGILLDNTVLGDATATLSSSAYLSLHPLSAKKSVGWNRIIHEAEATLNVARLDYNGYEYTGIEVKARADSQEATASLTSADQNAHIGLYAEAAYAGDGMLSANTHVNIYNLNPRVIKLADKLGANSLSAQIDADALWRSAAKFSASVDLSDVVFTDSIGERLDVGDITLTADNLSPGLNSIEIASDFVNGDLRGHYNPASLAADIKRTLAGALPIINGLSPGADAMPTAPSFLPPQAGDNAFDFDLTIDNAHDVCEFFHLPVYLDDPVRITGDYDCDASTLEVDVDAPVFINGKKLVKNTLAHVKVNGATGRITSYATSLFPTKKGDMQIEAVVEGIDGVLSTKVDWKILRDKPINGQLNLNAYFSRSDDGLISTRIGLRHSTINFGDAVWTIMPNASDQWVDAETSESIVAGKVESVIEYNGRELNVSDFVMQTTPEASALSGEAPPHQSIKINGQASASPDDHLVVEMDNIQMLHIFETLDIDKALICGSATGTVDVSALFSKTPQIKSTRFNVNGIGYNGCVLGDADVKLGFNPERGSFDFLADIVSNEGRRSVIDGWITPADEGISLKFDADRVKVGFMKPFVSAFCSDIEGYASGQAELFGTFKYINMRGDLFAEDLRMKIEYTNTWYSATDSLHLSPGLINLDNITLHDGQGGSATLNGKVTHQYFKRAGFDFDIRVNPGKPMLCYNIPPTPENPDQRWYGEIYGRDPSHVRVHGIPGDERTPGHVDISIYATTAPKSVFTFELSDLMVAQDYTFLTFRDVTPKKIHDQYLESPTISKSELWAARHQNADADDLPTQYRIDITANVTPQAKAILVMDPVGRDAIEAYGSGLLNLIYDSAEEDLTMRGTYTLDHGSYQFTLQDLIFRNFKIDRGSRIIFDGDPYQCQLDITAQYTLKANLSDLDESFLTDKDLNSTKVDVAAILKVGGQINDLSIKFDLAFPHLNQDIYRKVRSIISTDEMMSRQIVYLMTLNRFYTPEYMSTTKGNELFSVASSTISAQLSNALGKLSDNWTISPNVRSDRGDFSDVEVDLQLSSALLDNKLLFNGNFGYRDKSLNTNQFVGDFDIEYLLNPSGSLRLRAYNRYNDQNYYLRTAQTTQGVGIVIKHDFDTFRRLFRGFFRHPRRTPAILLPAPDSLITAPDTLSVNTDSIH